jgi:hypothetical protein
MPFTCQGCGESIRHASYLTEPEPAWPRGSPKAGLYRFGGACSSHARHAVHLCALGSASLLSSRLSDIIAKHNLANSYTPFSTSYSDTGLATYIVLLEDDALNYCHLVDASLPALLDKYIAERLHQDQNDWLTEDTCNVLAVALFWYMTS